MNERPRLIAGTSGDERTPATHPGSGTDWHLPAHLRDPRGVRTRQAAQVAAGADVLMAQTMLTHRRALARVGEARRAREATLAAVTVARSAIEEGLEGRGRRQAEAEQGEDDGDDAADRGTAEADAAAALAPLPEDLPVLIAGVLPAIGDDPGSGRLGSIGAALARDAHDAADLLAEAGIDLILVEAPSDHREAAVAASAAASTGLPVWAEVPVGTGDPTRLIEPVVAWLEALAPARPGTILFRLAVPDGDRPQEPWLEDIGAPFGAMFAGIALGDTGAEDSLVGAADRWLTAGAAAIGISDGADPASIAVIRRAIERHRRSIGAARESQRAPWRDWIAAGAKRAPAGAALWLGSVDRDALPAGFAWTVADPNEVTHMPDGAYRLIVADDLAADLAADLATNLALRHTRLVRLLDDRGILMARAARTVAGEDLEILDVDASDGHSWFIARRREGR